MVIYPIKQTAAGDGNTVVSDREIKGGKQSIHFIFTGTLTASLSVKVSNEPENPTSWVTLTTVSLDSTTPVVMYDLTNRYKHLKITVDSVDDGDVSAYPYPVKWYEF